jgi:CRP-like cAMP-binding protein
MNILEAGTQRWPGEKNVSSERHHLSHTDVAQPKGIAREYVGLGRKELALVRKIGYFASKANPFVEYAGSLMVECKAFPGDYICRRRTAASKMFFLADGHVSQIREKRNQPVKVVKHLNSGAHFGEDALCLPHYQDSIKALSICKMYSLDRAALVKLENEFPDFAEEVRMMKAKTGQYKAMKAKEKQQRDKEANAVKKGDTAKAKYVPAFSLVTGGQYLAAPVSLYSPGDPIVSPVGARKYPKQLYTKYDDGTYNPGSSLKQLYSPMRTHVLAKTCSIGNLAQLAADSTGDPERAPSPRRRDVLLDTAFTWSKSHMAKRDLVRCHAPLGGDFSGDFRGDENRGSLLTKNMPSVCQTNLESPTRPVVSRGDVIKTGHGVRGGSHKGKNPTTYAPYDFGF